MPSQALVQQVLLFVSSTGEYDEVGLFANNLIQQLAANSAGNALTGEVRQYRSWNGTAWTFSSYFEITCYVPASFQPTIQANIPALQAAFPQYNILTYGLSVTWGH